MLCIKGLKFVPDWFVTKKMLEYLDNAVFFNDDIVFVNADSNNVTFFSDDMGLVKVDVNNVSLDDVYFDDDDPETIIHVRLLAWCNRYSKKEVASSMAPNKMAGLVQVRQ